MKFLTVKQVAEMTGFKPCTIRAKACRWRMGLGGGLEYRKVWSRLMFVESEVWRDLGLSSIGAAGPEPSDEECQRRHLAALARIAARRCAWRGRRELRSNVA